MPSTSPTPKARMPLRTRRGLTASVGTVAGSNDAPPLFRAVSTCNWSSLCLDGTWL